MNLTYNIQIWMKWLQYCSFPVAFKAFDYHLQNEITARWVTLWVSQVTLLCCDILPVLWTSLPEYRFKYFLYVLNRNKITQIFYVRVRLRFSAHEQTPRRVPPANSAFVRNAAYRLNRRKLKPSATIIHQCSTTHINQQRDFRGEKLIGPLIVKNLPAFY